MPEWPNRSEEQRTRWRQSCREVRLSTMRASQRAIWCSKIRLRPFRAWRRRMSDWSGKTFRMLMRSEFRARHIKRRSLLSETRYLSLKQTLPIISGKQGVCKRSLISNERKQKYWRRATIRDRLSWKSRSQGMRRRFKNFRTRYRGFKSKGSLENGTISILWRWERFQIWGGTWDRSPSLLRRGDSVRRRRVTRRTRYRLWFKSSRTCNNSPALIINKERDESKQSP